MCFFFSSVLRANVSAFRVQPGPYDHEETPDLHVGTVLVALPQSHHPAGPGLTAGLAP